VQIAEYAGGRQRIVEHVGSAHTEAELGLLLARARELLESPSQAVLDLRVERSPRVAAMAPPPDPPVLFQDSAGREPVRDGPARVVGTESRLLFESLRQVFTGLGFDVVGDEVFTDLVISRIVEPTSLLDSGRVLRDLGREPASYATMKRCLAKVATGDYRSRVAEACFAHAATNGDVSLVLYDVTTLYFEAEKEDDLRKVGYSKERRVDPQIVVGLLVDRAGFPLEIGCFEGNKAETATIIPIIRQFQDRHQLADMVVVADAGMLSAGNLGALDEAGMRFIVGSRQTKAPGDLEGHFRWHGDAFDDGQVIDTITPRHSGSRRDTNRRAEPVWDPGTHAKDWRAVWAYSRKRAVRDERTLTLQENRAKAIIDGEKQAKSVRFVKTTSSGRSLDDKALARARRLVGLKGYVTNIPATIMPAGEVISSYHDLWRVEQSFRMSKTDLRARPMFHRQKDAIEAHLTIVFTALAVARRAQQLTGLAIGNIVKQLRPLRSATIAINGAHQTFPPEIPTEKQAILNALQHPKLTH
jgi:hypothetical protein